MRAHCVRQRNVAAVLRHSFAVLIGTLLGAFALTTTVAADVITVTTASGADDSGDGNCSLFEAVLAVKAQSPHNECGLAIASGTDRIEFAIPGGGVQTINVPGLPQVDVPVVIDGYTQPGTSVNTDPQGNNAVLLLHLRGVSISNTSVGFWLRSSGVVLRGFVISNFNYGVVSDGDDTIIEGNRVGTTPDGTGAAPNGEGIDINGGMRVTIGGTSLAARNLISGNVTHGVNISSHDSDVAVMGNDVGVSVSGNVALPNGFSGVRIEGGAGHQVGGGDGTTPGGICSGACNVISGNLVVGVYIKGAGVEARANRVWGNRIGLRRSSNDLALPNGQIGIMIENSADNTIGGGTPATRNVISGNGRGIEIRSAGATGNVVQGNFIGTNVTGTQSRGNEEAGVLVHVGASGNTIGGTTGTTPGGACTGACNLISGNRIGIGIESTGSTGNQIVGNYVGTNANGTASIGSTGSGIELFTPGNTIGGTTPQARNIVSGNSASGILLGYTGAGGIVQGNYIGVNAAGTAALGNGTQGVVVGGGVTGGTVGGVAAGSGNVISGNTQSGILVAGSGVQMLGNLIGTDKDGTTRLPNADGITVTGPNSQIGGPSASARNVVSGNNGAGVIIQGAGASGAQMQGNSIGLLVSGAVLPNLDDGVLVDGAPSASIGGTTAGAANVISGNEGNGVRIRGAGSTGAQILGNSIGTTLDGNSGRGNHAAGVLVESAPSVTIGNGTVAARNVISDNGSHGIWAVGGSGHSVRGNAIGTTTGGAPTLGNVGAGIALLDATNTAIGGTTAGQGNTVAGNGGHGVIVEGNASVGNVILGNAMFANVGIGIDLGDDGVTPNDGTDSDSGPNNRQNFPIVTSAAFTGTASTPIVGSLNSAPSTAYRIELFTSAAADPTGHGEGQTFLGAATVNTDGAGAAAFSVNLPVALPVGQVVTATATDPQNNTSEFGQARAVAVNTCTPRPQVTVSTASNGDGRLRVTIGSTVPVGTPANRLIAIEFKAGTNSLVDIAGQTGRTGAFMIPLNDRPSATTFFVGRATSGQPVQLPFAVIDDCGPWQTFVGGGAGAF
jgi:hypothetical protein